MEVSWVLVHRNSQVTRAVYVQEIRTIERQARRRARMGTVRRHALSVLEEAPGTPRASQGEADVRELRRTVGG